MHIGFINLDILVGVFYYLAYMKTKYGKVKLIVDHTGKLDDHTVKDILTHIQHNKRFALATPDEDQAMVYFPKELTARHTNGTDFIYTCIENFIDSIKLTLLSYPVFMSCYQVDYKDKKVLLLNSDNLLP